MQLAVSLELQWMDQIASLFCAVIDACSVLGSILLILGLYILLWGKKRDASSSAAAKEEGEGEKEEDEEEEEDKEKQVRYAVWYAMCWLLVYITWVSLLSHNYQRPHEQKILFSKCVMRATNFLRMRMTESHPKTRNSGNCLLSSEWIICYNWPSANNGGTKLRFWRVCSKMWPTLSKFPSQNGDPIIWSPTGSPAAPPSTNPQGTTNAGSPAKLTFTVMISPAYMANGSFIFSPIL